MSFTRNQRNTAYGNLNTATQDFISSTETTEIISTILEKFKLDESQAMYFDSEIFSTMLDLQTFDELVVNLEKNSNLSTSAVLGIAADLNSKIFKKIEELKRNRKDVEIEPQDSLHSAASFNTSLDSSKSLLLDEGNEHLIEAPEPLKMESVEMQDEPVVSSLKEAGEGSVPTKTAPSIDTSHVFIPPKTAVDAKLEELKKNPENTVMEKVYPGNDPYRESIG